ncbi:type II toxin-antitoxin system RatA family toxin [Pararhodobacter marinus]|uniref:Ubiquinone-binding protein n=1 Tax=Pararhodobacter marinus TaxID=2184063 RepID=A0A2U2CGI8_9RHOB|nr:type II toxin-antitoxin system RatA family toxin [Pararhodobacter marinus]PWE31005.1 ubiquinone-binding protein [Pararhodobacter marinus]
MPHHRENRQLPYRADQIYDLVADVAKYPEFLPWTAAARIRSREPLPERGEGAEVMEADLVISFKVFREKFGSRVVLIPTENRIETDYLDGPFKYLHSFWQIEPEGDGCRVTFEVDFEFRNAMLQRVIGLVFNEAMRRVVGAFEARARQLYG